MSDQNPGDEQLPNHIAVGIIIGHFQNPYEPTSQMACHFRVLNVVHMAPTLLAIERFRRPWGLRKKGRHKIDRKSWCRGSSGIWAFWVGHHVYFCCFFLKMTRLRKSRACLSSTSKNLLSSHWGFMKIHHKNLDTRCFICNRLYMVSQLHLGKRWYEVSTTSGTSTASHGSWVQ